MSDVSLVVSAAKVRPFSDITAKKSPLVATFCPESCNILSNGVENEHDTNAEKNHVGMGGNHGFSFAKVMVVQPTPTAPGQGGKNLTLSAERKNALGREFISSKLL